MNFALSIEYVPPTDGQNGRIDIKVVPSNDSEKALIEALLNVDQQSMHHEEDGSLTISLGIAMKKCAECRETLLWNGLCLKCYWLKKK